MKPNISSTDRMTRVLIAALAAILYFTQVLTGFWGIAFLAVGGILLLTSMINFCPIYYILGMTTRKKTQHDGVSHQV
jgi:hypothetical protein